MTTLTLSGNQDQFQDALAIPALAHDEAGALSAVEAQRLLALMASLTGDDWLQPTDCSAWRVREIVAHLAGAVAAQASWAEFRRQNMGNPYMSEVEIKIDAINRRQVEDRAGIPPEELVAEYQENAPQALRTRQRLPWLLRQLRLPLGPPLGFTAIGYLMDTIYLRDQWMHRQDIALATGKALVHSAGHDGRIMALVIRDLGRKLQGQLEDRRIRLVLTGAAGGNFSFGKEGEADALIVMDTATFNRLASGRLPLPEAMAQTSIDGDRAAAVWFLEQVDVPY